MIALRPRVSTTPTPTWLGILSLHPVVCSATSRLPNVHITWVRTLSCQPSFTSRNNEVIWSQTVLSLVLSLPGTQALSHLLASVFLILWSGWPSIEACLLSRCSQSIYWTKGLFLTLHLLAASTCMTPALSMLFSRARAVHVCLCVSPMCVRAHPSAERDAFYFWEQDKSVAVLPCHNAHSTSLLQRWKGKAKLAVKITGQILKKEVMLGACKRDRHSLHRTQFREERTKSKGSVASCRRGQ